MRAGAPFPILFFACAAHGMHHALVALYLTLVLVLSKDWGLGYADLISLWTLGSLLIGLGAPLAGWMGDRWGETRMLVVLFAGLGLSSALCGLAQGPLSLQLALALLGLFGAIYHPVGVAWVVKHASARGRAVATAGIAGSIGVGFGPIIAAGLADLWGWRAAFILPGVATMAFGAALIWFYATGRIVDRKDDAHAAATHHSTAPMDIRRTFLVLAVTMTLTLVAYSAFSTALPKLVEQSLGAGWNGIFAVGLAAGLIQLFGASAQFVGGHFADKGATKRAYVLCFVLLAGIFSLAAAANGWALVFAAMLTAFLFEGMAPLETLLVARYAPQARRGLVFGLRYGLTLAGAPAGVWLVSRLYDPEAGFFLLLMVSAGLVAICAPIAIALPADGKAAAASDGAYRGT